MENKKCTLSLRSQTYAMKALTLLAESSVKSKLISVNPDKTEKGCSWGIELYCTDIKRAKSLLNQKNIPFGVIR